jgi:protease-4
MQAGETLPQDAELKTAMADALLEDMLKERRSERRWRTIRRSLLVAAGVGVALVYVAFYATTFGYRLMPSEDVAGVVRIDGEISAGTMASADLVIPALRAAIEAPQVKVVVLAIDSPGGAPAEAERIYRAIEALKARHKKPVISVIQNMGASAAYMIALHTERIYAANYSLVGSVGAVLTSWDLSRAMERLHVSQRVYASGDLKAMLNPFIPVTPAADRKATELVHAMGASFKQEVARARGEKLKKDVDYATGEVWSGAQAVEIGLVDEIGTLDEVVERLSMKPHPMGPFRNPFQALLAQAQGTVMQSLLGVHGGVRWY